MKQLLRIFFRMAALLLALAATPAFAQNDAKRLDIPKNLKPYFVALLVKGDHFTEEQTPDSMDLLRQHLAYIRTETEKHVYVFAGPLTGDKDIAGMIVLRAESLEQAADVLHHDPAVRAGRFKVNLYSAMFAEIESTPAY